jgi:pyruvate dehydrogenase E2 component (dihydrolipoamide acetyltransferase)
VKRLFPALVPPWTLVLALGAAESRPVVRSGALAQARIVSVTLSLDGSFVETVEAARVLNRFRTLMENPALLAPETHAG